MNNLQYEWKQLHVKQRVDSISCNNFNKIKKTKTLYLDPHDLQGECAYTFVVNVTSTSNWNAVTMEIKERIFFFKLNGSCSTLK